MNEALRQGQKVHLLVESLMALEPWETYSRTTMIEPDVKAEHLQDVISATRMRMASSVSSTIANLQSSGNKKFKRQTLSGITSAGEIAVTLIITRIK